MARLGLRALAVWRDALHQSPEVVVEPAIPILYFGDLEAYRRSGVKVVTVGLNPSREEFPVGDRFRRFPGARDPRDFDGAGYLEALNGYFRTEPYRAWFSTFEYLLNGVDASYYPSRRDTVLHTDLCSPVATDPTWSGLDHDTRRRLIASGRPLWHDLMRALRPQVMLISVARHHLAEIGFPSLEAPWELYRLEGSRSRPYVVRAWNVSLDDDVRSLLVFGQAAQRPFGTVSRADKEAIGRRIGEVVDG
jgi:hypothetical protein